MKIAYKKSLKSLFWLSIILIICSIGLTTLSLHYSPVALQNWLDSMNIFLTIIRCSAYVLILLSWPSLIRMIGKRYQWNNDYITHIIHQRYKLFTWLVILELVLAQNIVGHFIQIIADYV